MQSYKALKVWQRRHALVLTVYGLTARFPRAEIYGLTSQLRRAATSVPANIAEGSKRRTAGDYARFLNLAEASLAETEYLVLLSRDLGYVALEAAQALLTETSEIGGMVWALRRRVEAARKDGPRSTVDG